MTEPEVDSVGDFLNEFYPHFAIMGIFGTIALFLNGSISGDGSELIARGGILAVLAIFAYTAAWIGWRALSELLTGLPEAERHLFTEFGYALIVISTFTIATTIVDKILNSFGELWSVAISVAAVAIGFVLYARNYPVERYNQGNASPSSVAFFALVFSIYLIFPITGDSLSVVINQHFTEHWVVESVYVFIFATIHLTMSETLLGIEELHDWIRSLNWSNIKIELPNVVKVPTWSMSFSATIGLFAVVILDYGLEKINEIRISGVLALWGVNWEILVTYHLLLLTMAVALTVWLQPSDLETRKRVSSGVAICFLVVCIAEILLAFAQVASSTPIYA